MPRNTQYNLEIVLNLIDELRENCDRELCQGDCQRCAIAAALKSVAAVGDSISEHITETKKPRPRLYVV